MKKYILIASMCLLSVFFLPGCETGVSAGETYNYGPYDDQGFGWGDAVFVINLASFLNSFHP